MKKTFQLQAEGKHPDRVLEAVKNDIRKYFKRERRRELPAGANYWHFDCKFGLAEATAQAAKPGQLIDLIDAAAKEGAQQFYVEILAAPGQREAKLPEQADEAESGGDS